MPETINILPRAQFLSTRGHPLKLAKICSRTPARGAFFNQRVVSLWNSLPEDVVSAPSINAFKNRLDKHWHNVPFRYDFKAVATPVSYRNTTIDMRSGQYTYSPKNQREDIQIGPIYRYNYTDIIIQTPAVFGYCSCQRWSRHLFST